MQKTFNESFADTAEWAECTNEVICTAITALVDSYDTVFREILSNMAEKQKELLYSIALDGEATAITSSAFIRRHSLSSASSVQAAVKKLIENKLVTKTDNVYSITDRFLAIWLTRQMGSGNPLRALM